VSESRHFDFETCALASGLLSVEQLEEAKVALRAASPPEGVPAPTDSPRPIDHSLADRLVEAGVLNPWQAKQLLDGRSKFTLGPYRIVDSLGQGGMGHVYKAKDPILDRFVAIKVLPRDRSTPEAIANFTREIQALASFNHPKLVRALDEGHDGNVYYLVLEYVPGADLRRLVRGEGPLGMERGASIISQVAEGLQHAHEHGMVHRDVKPGNVLVTTEGEAKLSDLGLAGPMTRGTDDDPRWGKIVGTADYLSPDHIADPWNPTPAWDIYSLGCTMYYAVTGKVPFPGGTTAEKARAHCELRPLDPRRLNHAISDSFVDLLADMMAKDPAERIASAAEVVQRLAPWASRAPWNQRAAANGPGAPDPALPGAVPTRGSVAAATPTLVTAAPLIPEPPPPAGSSGNLSPLVLPPPVVRPLLSPAAGPPLLVAVRLRDTVSDLPSPPEPVSSDGQASGDSVSLVVVTQRPAKALLVLLLVLLPIALAAAALLIGWLWDVWF
jgi:serine/threonine protein kinase